MSSETTSLTGSCLQTEGVRLGTERTDWDGRTLTSPSSNPSSSTSGPPSDVSFFPDISYIFYLVDVTLHITMLYPLCPPFKMLCLHTFIKQNSKLAR